MTPASLFVTATGIAAAVIAVPLAAQRQTRPPARDTIPITLPSVTVIVTPTRTPKEAFDVPAAVNIIDSAAIRARQPNSAADLFREQPGLDVTGVGTNQVRPAIRGQRGQRIVLLQDGIRLNNSRRQQDFGEIPAVVDVNAASHIEVVRGPSSVLYGTDAIGGVVNLISPALPTRATGLHGRAGYLYGSQDDQQRPSGMIEQRVGRFAYRVSGMYRHTSDYTAPAGRFGNIRLGDDERVHDTGVRDVSTTATLGFDLSATQRLTLRGERYQADDAGFGYVRPDALGPNQPLIRLRYPEQTVERYALGYRAQAVRSPLADRVEVTAYAMRNERSFTQDIFIPFTQPGVPAGAGVSVQQENLTDLGTIGMRAEATKVIATRHALTYGVDAFRDRSENADSGTTTVIGFGPPRPQTSTAPLVPNAHFRSIGAFVQGDLRLADPLSLILGVRVQDVRAGSRPTPGLTAEPRTSRDRTAVGTANVLFRVSPNLNLVASVGRGFRSPNLIERFFNGPTPEGGAFQSPNPDLEPETSLNTDVGARVRAGRLSAELFAFRNEIRNGIRIAPRGDSVNRVPVFQDVNIDKLRFTGLEAEVAVLVASRVTASANYSHIRSKDVLRPENPVGATYSDKLVGDLTYRHPGDRVRLGYTVRRNGRQKEDQISLSPLIGAELPAFTVHALRGNLRFFQRGALSGTLTLAVENLTDALYAESSNVSFFRPEPGRRLIAGWTFGF
ncbi:MAG: TonB-dependent receptor [Gemmatimonadaceae bacterium]